MDDNNIRTSKIIHFLPNGQFYFERGVVAFREGQMNEAIQYFKRASELEPREPIILCQLAICYTEVGEFRKSNQLLRNILENLDHKLSYCYYFIANNFAYMKDYKRAIQYANRYIALEPEGEYYAEAEDLIDVLLEESPKSTLLENRFGEFEQQFSDYRRELNRYLAEEDNESAGRLLEKIIQDKPSFWPAYNQLASLYFEQLNEEKGLRTLADLLKRSPGNLLGLADLLHYHYYASHRLQTEECYEHLCQVVPILTHHKEKLAVIHSMMGQHVKACQLFASLADLEITDQPEFYYYYAKSAYYNHQVELAHELWEQFLACDVYEQTMFPFQSADLLASDTQEVLDLLASRRAAKHLLGVYALSVSEVRVELVLFHPLFDMSKWSYIEHLIYTNFNQLPESLAEKNGAILIQVWNHFADHGLPLTKDTQAFYLRMSELYMKLTASGESFLKAGFAHTGARFLVQCGDYTKAQAARFFGIDDLDF